MNKRQYKETIRLTFTLFLAKFIIGSGSDTITDPTFKNGSLPENLYKKKKIYI